MHPLVPPNNTEPKKGDFVVMLWTGLKDINKKDIYEGDIVMWRGLKDSVRWFESTAGFAPFGGGIGEWKPEQTEILGNIYQNEELLVE